MLRKKRKASTTSFSFSFALIYLRFVPEGFLTPLLQQYTVVPSVTPAITESTTKEDTAPTKRLIITSSPPFHLRLKVKRDLSNILLQRACSNDPVHQ